MLAFFTDTFCEVTGPFLFFRPSLESEVSEWFNEFLCYPFFLGKRPTFLTFPGLLTESLCERLYLVMF